MNIALKDKRLGIYVEHHTILIQGETQAYKVDEMCLRTFEKFYKNWVLAFQCIEQSDSFIDAYTNNPSFKFLLREAFNLINVDIDDLTVRQIEALVVTYEWEDKNRQSVIFRVHKTYPKFPTQVINPIVTSKDYLSLISSRLQKTSPYKLADHIYLMICHFGIYILSWLFEKLPE